MDSLLLTIGKNTGKRCYPVNDRIMVKEIIREEKQSALGIWMPAIKEEEFCRTCKVICVPEHITDIKTDDVVLTTTFSYQQFNCGLNDEEYFFVPYGFVFAKKEGDTIIPIHTFILCRKATQEDLKNNNIEFIKTDLKLEGNVSQQPLTEWVVIEEISKNAQEKTSVVISSISRELGYASDIKKGDIILRNNKEGFALSKNRIFIDISQILYVAE